MSWRITVTPIASKMLSAITDRRTREKLVEAISRLAEEPKQLGKPLLGELSGLYSTRAVGQRYRIIYAIREEEIVVIVVAVGLRREGARDDIYALAKKLFRLNLLDD